jgi:transposase
MAKPIRSYGDEFKREAVRLVLDGGLSCSQVSRDIGVNVSTLRDWCRQARRIAEQSTQDGSAESRRLKEEVARLRQENSILKEKREILKKAAAFFAREGR